MERANWLHSTDPRRAAAAWHALMDSETLPESERASFADWLRKSPAHLEEFIRLSTVREQLRDSAVFDGVPLEEIRALIGRNVDTLAHGEEGLISSPSPQTPPSAFRHRKRWLAWGLATAASVLLICGIGWLAIREVGLWGLSLFGPTAVYTTGVGEQRSIVLPDGSIAELNTRSRVRLHFSPTAREATLIEGEALFHVAKDSQRAFRVYSADAVVQAIGTEFTVRRESDQTTVTVFEGRVSVAPSPEQKLITPTGSQRAVAHVDIASVELTPGERLAIAPGRSIQAAPIQKVNTANALAWKERRLVFDDLKLAAVVAEFNRYNRRQIHVEGAELYTRSITGVFNANDPDSFVSFLEGTASVTITRTAAGDIFIRPGVHAGERAVTF